MNFLVVAEYIFLHDMIVVLTVCWFSHGHSIIVIYFIALLYHCIIKYSSMIETREILPVLR